MTQLVAPEAMLRRFRKMRRQEGIQAFLQAASKPRTVHQRLPALKAVTEQRRASQALPEKLGEPTSQRAAKAVEVRETRAPPFNVQVLGPAQKLAKQLGQDTMMVLERLYEVGAKGGASRGLTSSYDMTKIDVSRTSYDHLTIAEAEAHEIFRAAMACMPPELQRYARELVLEDVGAEINSARGAPPRRSRTLFEVGSEISGYTSDQRYTTGAVVATLKIVSWCVQRELGVRRRKK